MKFKKSFVSLLLVVALLCTMIVPASAATEPTLTVTPNVTKINSGTGTADVIYTVSLNPNGNQVAAFQFALTAPEGMTLSKDEVYDQSDDGYWINQEQLMRVSNKNQKDNPFSTFAYEPTTGRFGASGGMVGKTLDTTAVIMTIKATVDISATKTYTLGVTEFICFGAGTVNQGGSAPIVTDVEVTAAPKPATNITLDKSTMELYTGGTGTLTATVTPADTTDTIEWSTDNATVATVVNGTVNAVAPGTATITVKAGDYTATCTVTVTNAPCTHEHKTPVPEQESTCAVKGWDAYQTCDDCGKFFDAAGNEISGIPYRTLKAHTPGAPATEDTDQTCTECGAVITPALGHIHANHLTPVEAVVATCTVDGNTVYYQCSCGKLFTDDTATTETTLEAVTINAFGHDHSGAWVSDDDEHWKVCAREGCGERLDTAAHNPSDWTFIGDGHHDKRCTVCGKQVAHEACESTIKYDDAKHWHECIKCGNISGDKEDHSYAPKSETNPNPDKCTGCDYVKSSIKVTVPETTETETGSKNPTTGAADNGMIGIAAAVLVAAGAAYVGFKKRG